MTDIHAILKKYWGYDGFRELQEDIISSVLGGCDTLGLMPTGGGKSITFQVPAMAMPGMALVVTPIVSLMKDQVDGLVARGIKATYMHAGLTMAEVRRTYEKCINGNCKFLYVSPERLRSDSFLDRLKRMPVNMIVVDEAHCISQWGYDFRPSFLKIADVRTLFPAVPVLALTATATPAVVADIMRALHFRNGRVLRKSFARPNVVYVVRHTEEKLAELVHVLSSVAGSAIVYVRSRKRTKEIADVLNARGISAIHYHAGLAIEDKSDKQDKWRQGEIRVMVATNAFGMGIDKPDVRMVVHVDVPNSIEEYYQEAGRAGRDGHTAYAVLLAKPTDRRTLERHITDAFPEKDFIKKVYERVGNFLHVAVGEGYERVYDFNFTLFCRTFKLPVLPTHSALRLLTQAGYIEFVEEVDTQSRVMILVGKDELYNIDCATPQADRVLQAILRTYSGLFSDYVFISEDVIARRFGLSRDTVYEALLEFTRKHILHYVPRRRTPYVVYTTSREEPRYVQIPKRVYEDLRDRMRQRIAAMEGYVFSTDRCREGMMLSYFGEEAAKPCGHCDVCIDQRRRASHTRDDVREGILYMAQVSPRRAREFVDTLSFPADEVYAELEFLTDEGFIEHRPDGTYVNPVPLD